MARGAEAVLTEASWGSVPAVRKERVAKGYRIASLDRRLRTQRTALEASLLGRARRAGVAVPRVLEVGERTLVLEFIAGPRLKEALGTGERKADASVPFGAAFSAEKVQRKAMVRSLGEQLGRLHAAGVMHGDMTTSNAIWHERVWLIDFGLGRASSRPEDFAMDLHVLQEALKAAHFPVLKEAWAAARAGYRSAFPRAASALAQLEKVERRRRYA